MKKEEDRLWLFFSAESGVARFFSVQRTKNGEKYTKLPQTTQNDHTICSNGRKIYQHLALLDPPKFTQIEIFGLKIYHLASWSLKGVPSFFPPIFLLHLTARIFSVRCCPKILFRRNPRIDAGRVARFSLEQSTKMGNLHQTTAEIYTKYIQNVPNCRIMTKFSITRPFK
jgi:hypothetical protein